MMQQGTLDPCLGVLVHAIKQHLLDDKLHALDVAAASPLSCLSSFQNPLCGPSTVMLKAKLFHLCLQVPLYAINQHLVVEKLNALDVGGSITIHAFGAYYGLAASLVLSISGSGADHHKNGASYSSDMTAMIGTIFLWLFWVRDSQSTYL